jgi:hypothetical protein
MSALSEALKDVLVKFGVMKAAETPVEEKVSYEIVFEPDVKDAHEQWMTAETIEKGCANFNENLEAGVVQPNLFHLSDTDKFSIEKSWINQELDVVVSGSEEPIKAGAWVVKVKYHDDTLWALKKAGIVQGVSIGCMGNINEETGEITNLTFDGE